MLLWPASPLHQHLLIGPSIIPKQIVEQTIAYNGELMISRLLFFCHPTAFLCVKHAMIMIVFTL
jgi:hypothetical protein